MASAVAILMAFLVIAAAAAAVFAEDPNNPGKVLGAMWWPNQAQKSQSPWNMRIPSTSASHLKRIAPSMCGLLRDNLVYPGVSTSRHLLKTSVWHKDKRST